MKNETPASNSKGFSKKEYFYPEGDPRRDWENSGVKPEIIDENVGSITGHDAFFKLKGKHIKRYQSNGNPLRKGWHKKYQEFANTRGWWVQGVDILAETPGATKSDWGRYKPTEGQIIDPVKNKPMKYVAPQGEGIHPVFLGVDNKTWVFTGKGFRCEPDLRKEKSYWNWVLKNPQVPITLVEGEKKAGALLSLGIPAIATCGIWGWAARTETNRFTLPEELKIFNQKGRTVHILFDYAPIPNDQQDVFYAAKTLGKCFDKVKDVFIGVPPGPEKGIDDFIMAGGKYEDIIFRHLLAFNWEKDWQITRKIDLKLSQQFLDANIIPKDPNIKMVVIRSPKGSGKTTILQQIVREYQRKNRKVFILTNRIAFGKACCEALGVPWITDLRKYFEAEGNGKFDTRILGFGMCLDSLIEHGQGRFNRDDFEDALIIIDEGDQAATHVLGSETCKKNRVEIIDNLGEALRAATGTDGRVLLLDADLSEITINFFQAKAALHDNQVYVIENVWKKSPWPVKLYTDKDPSALYSKAVDEVNNGGRIWVTLDCQKPNSIWSSTNAETWFQSKCPGKKFLRIDSTTLNDPTHAAYGAMERINDLVLEYDGIIVSPAITSGVSVDVRGHFTGVYGVYKGVGTPADTVQALARVRECIPRHIWVAKIAVNKVAHGEKTANAIVRTKCTEATLNLRLLGSTFNSKELKHESINSWARFGARQNIAAANYRLVVKEWLENEGHNLEEVTGVDKETKEECKEIKEENMVVDAKEVANSEDISELQYETLKKRQTKTKKEQNQERKHEINKRFGQPTTERMVLLAETRGFYSALKKHYHLTKGYQFIDEIDWRTLSRFLGKGLIPLQDLRLIKAQIELLKKIGIEQLLEDLSQEEWTKDTPKAIEFVEKLRKLPRDAKNILGITITEKTSTMTVIQNLLKTIGLKLTSQRRANPEQPGNENRKYYFKFTGESAFKLETPELREEIFKYWESQDLAMRFKETHSYDRPIPAEPYTGDYGEDTTTSYGMGDAGTGHRETA